MFSCEFCKISKNTFSTEHLRANASAWCNNSCRAYQKLGQGDFYSFDQEKVSFISSYLRPTTNRENSWKKKKNYHQLYASIN